MFKRLNQPHPYIEIATTISDVLHNCAPVHHSAMLFHMQYDIDDTNLFLNYYQFLQNTITGNLRQLRDDYSVWETYVCVRFLCACACLHVLVITYAQVQHCNYWHSSRRPEGFTEILVNNCGGARALHM